MTKLILSVVVIGVVAGGGYWYVSQQVGGEGAAVPFMADVAETEGKTFATILSSGGTVQCDVAHSDAGSTVSGTVYMDGSERIRGDFTVTGILDTDMHILRTDGYTYVWGGSFTQGIKSAVTEENKDELFTSKDASIPEDVEYSCSPWVVSESMFALPEEITFIDPEELMGSFQGSADANVNVDAAQIKAMQCAACEQAGEAREECRRALQCQE